jgi:hypothetical protein
VRAASHDWRFWLQLVTAAALLIGGGGATYVRYK